jgi:lambda repressor-like predicted transcriptional regulator
MTARDEILAALPSIEGTSGDDTFTPQDVVAELRRRGSTYAESTIRTHVVSRMCANTADHHARVYDDLARVSQVSV